MLYVFFLSMFVTSTVALLLIRYVNLHQKASGDNHTAGPQKFHIGLTPRIGGIPIVLGFCVGAYSATLYHSLQSDLVFNLILSASPVFVLGLGDDILKRVSPLWRLLSSFVSAALACMLMATIIPHIGVPGSQGLFDAFPLLAWIFTVVAVGGLCHSLNIIDGYNGLASGVSAMVFLALAYVCTEVGDTQLFAMCIICAGSVFGFMIWNFPKGLIFAGDGGAYFVGFLIAELSILLVVRNPNVSPWFPFTLVIYPVWETVFTMYRRKVIQGIETTLPDSLHLHQMVFRRLVRWMVGKREAKHLLRRNSMTAPYLWGMGLLTVVPAVLMWQQPLLLQMCCLTFIIFYLWLYRRLVQFRSPRWLVIRKD